MKRLYYVFWLIIISVLLVVTGCGENDITLKRKNVKIINYWVWLDNPTDKTLPNLIKEFNEENKDIKVVLNVIPWGDYRNKLITSVTGGNPPDIAAFKITWLPEFTANRALEPLDKYIKKWKGKEDVLSNLWDIFSNASDDGKIYLMPWEIQVLYMYYRPSLFKKAGITNIPQTWHEWLIAAEKLTIDTDEDGRLDQYGFGMRGGRYGHEPWGSFVFANIKGNKIMENGKPVFDAIGGCKGNKLFIDLYKKYKVVPPTAPMDGFSQVISNFVSGRTAMFIHHIKSSQKMVATFGDDVNAFPVPAGEFGRWTSLGDTENALFKSAKNKEAAFKFISWLAEKEQIDRWDKATGNVPIVKSLQKLPYYQKNRFMKASFESLPFARTFPVNKKMGEWIELVWPATTQRALEGEIIPDQMLQTLAEKMTL